MQLAHMFEGRNFNIMLQVQASVASEAKNKCIYWLRVIRSSKLYHKWSIKSRQLRKKRVQ